jgi:protein TonB
MKKITFIRFSLLLVGLFIATTSFIQTNVPIAEHYEGGEEQLLKDIASELQYPPTAKRNRIQGTCIVHVKLMEDGHFDHVKVVTNKGGGTGEEAARIVKTLKFKAPGYVADYNIPVKFKL